MVQELEEIGYEKTQKKCPECKGSLFEKIEQEDEDEPLTVRTTCENWRYFDEGDCDYNKVKLECPQCGSREMNNETRGPDRVKGARSGMISCKVCNYVFNWSE